MKVLKILVLVAALAVIIIAGEVLGGSEFDKYASYDNYFRSQNQDGLWGLKDKDNSWVILPKYANIGYFRNGYVSVSCDGQTWGYADLDNNIVIQPNENYIHAYTFSNNGYAKVINQSGEIAYIDTKGEYLFHFQPAFDYASVFSNNNLALAVSKDTGLFGYADRKGELIIDLQYDKAYPFAENNLACVKQNEAYFYINTDSTQAFPQTFENASGFTDSNLAAVSVNGKWGYIDNTGSFIIEPKYDYAEDFYDYNNYHATVKYMQGEEVITCCIDMNGNTVE